MDDSGLCGAPDAYRGQRLAERYRLEEMIGQGAMGAVYRAWDEQRNQACAVKLLHAHVASRGAALMRFYDEIRIVARLCHPNIVDMYDQGDQPGSPMFLVMELLKGQDLHSLLQVQPRLPLGRSLEIVRQVGSALHTVHLSGIVHRDIKPRNIFLVRDGDGFDVKVIDFGLAKNLNSQPNSRGSDGLLIGTPEYLPPESWRGISQDIDARADQWALAVLTYRMLTGRLPFEGGGNTIELAREIVSAAPLSLTVLLPDIPPHVEAALMRAMSKEKGARFPSVNDFVRALHGRPLASEVEVRSDRRAVELAIAEEETRLKPLGGPAGLGSPVAGPAARGPAPDASGTVVLSSSRIHGASRSPRGAAGARGVEEHTAFVELTHLSPVRFTPTLEITRPRPLLRRTAWCLLPVVAICGGFFAMGEHPLRQPPRGAELPPPSLSASPPVPSLPAQDDAPAAPSPPQLPSLASAPGGLLTGPDNLDAASVSAHADGRPGAPPIALCRCPPVPARPRTSARLKHRVQSADQNEM